MSRASQFALAIRVVPSLMLVPVVIKRRVKSSRCSQLPQSIATTAADRPSTTSASTPTSPTPAGPAENRHRLHDLAARADHAIRLTNIAGRHEVARPRHHELGQVASLFLIRFDHVDKLALVTENPP
jgi:hypothetical protein